jgi:malate dehydrogenase
MSTVTGHHAYFFPKNTKEVTAMRNKVTVVGAGNVGSLVAERIFDKQLADVVLIDVLEGMPQGKALDLMQSAPIGGMDCRIIGTNDYLRTENSHIVVITAGLPRKPGMSRDDLLFKNYEIVKHVTENVVRYSPNCIIIMVSNPLDAMAQAAYRVSGFPRNRVLGMAGALDSARLRIFIAREVDASVEDVYAFVLGGHGDTMVPLLRYSTVAGIPITEWLPQDKIEQLIKRTQNAGAEIVSLLKTGSAFYAPSAGAVEMVESILRDKKRIIPCSIYLEGEYGIEGLFVGVPVKLGTNGMEQVIQLHLTEEEMAALRKSADAVKELVDIIKV